VKLRFFVHTCGLALGVVAFAAAFGGEAARASSQQSYAGTFALQGGTPRVAMRLIATHGRDALYASLDLWATADASSRVVVDYDVEQTKKMHVIVVSDDLATFMHLHPSPSSDGHFRIDLRVPQPALYHVYADSTPHGLGQQVFRFDISFAGGRATPVMMTAPMPTSKAGPYVVTLKPLTLKIGGATVLSVHIAKNGVPARDLREYLGSSAHAVFLHYGDLTYVHAHPTAGTMASMASMASMGSMGSMGAMGRVTVAPNSVVPPDMTLLVRVREPGFYRLWLQFRGGGKLYVASFWLRAAS
jgi:hypothetical protein